MKPVRLAIILAWLISSTFCAVLLAAPQFTNSLRRGTNFVFGGLGGSNNGAYALRSATNLTLPLTNWTALATNSFDGNGRFNLTNPIIPTGKRQFYALQSLPGSPLWIPVCGALLGAVCTNDDPQVVSNLEAVCQRGWN